MIINAEKFQAIITDKKGQNNNPTEINIDEKKVNSESSVLLLGSEIDSKLNFDKHISKLCKKSVGQHIQLNALNRLIRWYHWQNRKYSKKDFKISFKRLWKRLQNFTEKNNKCTIEVRILSTLETFKTALETFKTLNDLNPAFVEILFAKREVSKRRKNNL